MFGCFVLSVLATVGIVKLIHAWRWRRWGYAYGMGGGRCGGHLGGWRHGWHHHHHGGHGHGWHDGPYGDLDEDETYDLGAPPPYGFGRGRRGGFFFSALFHKLETRPEQESVIRDAVKAFRDEVEPLKAEGKRTRDDLAAALKKPSFDEVVLGELFARHDDAIEKARKAFVGLMAKLHDVLDERQRGKLADLLGRGPGFFRRRFGW